MLKAFEEHIAINLPFLKQAKCLVACSGGLDSIVLAYLCQSLNLNYSLAHCNYHLRSVESDGDQQFVEQLADKMQRKLYIKSFDLEEAKKNNTSIQLVARELRYQWFRTIAIEQGYDYILTAHHMDDSLETFLINLSRGTGINGLTGIPEVNSSVVRPLLPFSRTEIEEFARAEKLKWREDSSNSETKYLRNKIRHEIILNLKGLHTNFLENFKLTQQHLVETSALINAYREELKKNIFVAKDEVIRVSIRDLKNREPLKNHLYLLFEPYGFTQWNDIQQLLDATSGKKVYSKTHQLIKDRDALLLSKLVDLDDKVYTINELEELLDEPLRMTIKEVGAIANLGSNVLYVDGEKLKFPLMLRKWNNGDYFYPLGMKGKKKLSKFFKDEKLDVLSKKNVWLLCSDDEIVWVVGKRPDERYKVTNKTNKILKFELY